MSEKANILVVDDEEGIRLLITSSLKRFYNVVTAANVDEALKTLDRQSFDLIVSDVQMPGKSGEEMLELLVLRGIHIPVILITGHMDSGNRIAELKEKAFDCLAKPFSMKLLRELIETALHE